MPRILLPMFVFATALAVGAQTPPAPPKPATPATPPAPAQDPKPDAKALLAEAMQQFKDQGIAVDLEHHTVTLQTTVNEPPPPDPIEYLLIHRTGKRHEAILVTKAKPSVLNGALLMIGLQPGRNAQVHEKEPPPTPEEMEKGADPVVVVPPQGAPFWMTVSFQTKDGKAQELAIEDLLLDMSTQKPVRDASWVYLGGRLAPLLKNQPPVYMADYEGNLISVAYMSPDNHLGTMSHANGRDDHNWWVTDKVPDPGTAVALTFHRDKPKVVAEREARVAKEAAAEAAEAAKEAAKDKDKDKEKGKQPAGGK